MQVLGIIQCSLTFKSLTLGLGKDVKLIRAGEMKAMEDVGTSQPIVVAMR
jgi:hypothetical protein